LVLLISESQQGWLLPVAALGLAFGWSWGSSRARE
jgi:hypothetical protein